MNNIDTMGLVGLPFKERGVDFDGCDCRGLVALALRRAGFAIPATAEEELAAREALFENVTHVVNGVGPEVGDVVEIDLRGERHVGVIVEPGRVLHAVRGIPSRLDWYSNYERLGRVVCVYRPRGEGIEASRHQGIECRGVRGEA